MNVIKKIRGNLMSFKGMFFVIVGFYIIHELASLGLSFVIRDITNILSVGEVSNRFYKLLMVGCGLFLIEALTYRIFDYYKLRLGNLLTTKLETTYLYKIMQLDYVTISNLGTGKILTRFTNGVQAEQNLTNMTVNSIRQLVIKIIITFVTIRYILPGINFAIIIFGILILLFNKWIKKYTDIYQRAIRIISEKIGEIGNKMIYENLTLRINQKVGFEMDKINKLNKDYVDLNVKSDILGGMSRDFMYICLRLCEFGAFAYFGYMALINKVDIGKTVQISFLLRGIREPISTLIENMGVIRKNLNRFNKLQDLINKTPKIIEGNRKLRLTGGEIVFENLEFQYKKEKELLKNFNLTIPAKKITALVGHSGSGKSTLVKLILRLYDPLKGTVKIDNQDLRRLTFNSLYSNIGYLSQEPSIFNDSVRENILYSVQNKVNDEEIWEALKNAQAQELVKSMPKGLDTKLGEKGFKLSGGEKQRIAIARIFLKNPEIIILDEPTSALDSISENALNKSFKKLFKNKTVIVIAHRLQTVMNAHQIIVMEKGKIIQTGNHAKLLKQEGTYKTLVNLQNGIIQ